MMKYTAKCTVGLLALMTAGCASLGIKSVPWPTYTAVVDNLDVKFARSNPPIDPALAPGLHTRDMAADGKLIGLAVSGGGARAASYTLGILAELQKLPAGSQGSALDQIDFISSNSGGSWAVATWLAQASVNGGAYNLADNKLTILKQFKTSTRNRVTCLSAMLAETAIGTGNFGDVYKAGASKKLPAVFFNAALLPAQAPFVFTEGFLKHYQVESITTCKQSGKTPARSLQQVPIAVAAASSGSVPGFYAAFAETRLCQKQSPWQGSSFCRSRAVPEPVAYMRIADGGIYDNIGYKTGYEIMHSQKNDANVTHRGMIIVNSNTSIDEKIVKKSDRTSNFLASMATNGLFAVQDATFDRMRHPLFDAVGVSDIALLDFFSVSGFGRSLEDVRMLQGLKFLAFYAARNVSCLKADGQLDKGDQSDWPRDEEIPGVSASLQRLTNRQGDCYSENFYRAGNRNKTTYQFNWVLSNAMWELGQLTVRNNCPAILKATGTPDADIAPACAKLIA
ncbi:patatin-like phospholipase [Blastomonas natatoria]|uniref:Patatin-like phospholipase n=2 Tax=Blastomonas natatoria TaxID=34015 RepID=A0A2V3UYH4_9SPHN|nr:patatin-like phospholipase [Blastomonas natatoria]